jgi:outer membrane autotransporter protein
VDEFLFALFSQGLTYKIKVLLTGPARAEFLRKMLYGEAPKPVQTAALSPWEPPPDGTNLERDPNDQSGLRGLASGNGIRKNGLWVSGSWSDMDQDQTAIAFDGDAFQVVAGYDRLFLDDRLVVGASLGYEWADLDTTFNRGTLDSDGIVLAPYAAWLFNESFSVDLIFGYTWIDYDTTRNNGAITGSFDSDRWMLAGGLNYNYFKKNWTLGLRIGYLYTSEDFDAFTESNGTFNPARTNNLGIVTMGGQVGYLFGMVEPYLGAYYNHELVREDLLVSNVPEQPSNDPDEVQGVGGINLYPTETIRASLEVQHVFGRDDYDSTGVSMNLRWEF